MTLVFNEPREGPATHALIIGVEQSALGAGPFSAAASAHKIADLVLGIEIHEAPLGSVDLIVSPTAGRTAYRSPRDGKSHPIDSPATRAVRQVVHEWRTRLKDNSDSLGFFYYVGPVAGEGSDTTLLTPGTDGIVGLDFESLWSGMARNGTRRQLFFVDGCPSEALRPPQSMSTKLTFETGAIAPVDRACFRARLPVQPATAPGQLPSPFSEAVREMLAGERTISAAAIGEELSARFREHMAAARLTDFQEIEVLTEGLLVVGFRPWQGAPPPAAAKAGPPTKRDPTARQKDEPEYEIGQAESRFAPPPTERPPSSAGEAGEAVRKRLAEERKKPRLTEIGSDGAMRELSPKEAEARIEKEVAAQVRRQIATMTPRQRECLRLAGQGLSTAAIAERLGIAAVTVNRHLQGATGRLGQHDRGAAAALLAAFDDAPEPIAAPPDEAEKVERPADEGEAGAPTEPNTHFVSDDPEVERDELNRGPLAIALGRRLHRIWCRSNGIKAPGDDQVDAGGDERSAFVLHLDAPWGGGKTSFANFLTRVLNPFPRGGSEAARFLVERAGGAVGTIFIDDPPADGKEGGTAAQWPEDARRPWIVVQFNAWQAEHCSPPWWTFYQAIRKGCFAAVCAEGRSAARPAQASGPPRPLVEERIWSWASLWRRELWWRLRNPKVVARLATFAVAALALVVLWRTNIIFRGDEGPDFNAGNALGFLLAGIGGISGLWGLGALLTESVAPGTDDLAERRSLGGGDPFERFRRHFGRTMAGVRRPVMVIIDDLDRCRPDFVVDLVRGIQTLLKSPRVVFVILGDRDWIERAFEAHHAAMSKVNVGPEQDFGARFVEKAIQMSFILPEMAEPSQDSYVRRVLIGPCVTAAASDAPAPPPIAQQLRSDYREKVASAPTPEARKQAEDALIEQYRPQLEAAARAEAAGAAESPTTAEIEPQAASAVAEAQAGKVLSEERALLAAVDERMGQALLHRLEPLARFFPPNPRQIKRIVNAITMYTAVAYLQMEMDESDPRGIELAIWVIIMTEWPKTWRVLASCPQLADVLAAEDPAATLAAIEEGALPGSRVSTLQEVNRIRADRELFALITEEAEGRPRLHTASVETFVRLTPLYSRKQRLTEAEVQAGGAQS